MDLRSKVSSPLLAQSGHLDRACDRLRMYLYVRQICEGLGCWLTAQHATLKHSLLSLRLSPSCATRHRSNGRDTAEGMCRSCPRTEAQEADLWAALLGQIRLNDIAG
jgi:hypothetical protein